MGTPVSLAYTIRYEDIPNRAGWGPVPADVPCGEWRPLGDGSWLQRFPGGGWVRLRLAGGFPPDSWSPGP
jgi:hypothetical protein